MGITTTAGSTLRVVAAQPATYDVAGYATLFAAGVVVGEITDLGMIGRKYTPVKHNPVGSRGVKKLKGSFDEGQMSIKLALDTQNSGQILMDAGSKLDNDYSFEVAALNGNKWYFQAQIMDWTTEFGSVDSITGASCNLELTTNSAGVGIVKLFP